MVLQTRFLLVAFRQYQKADSPLAPVVTGFVAIETIETLLPY
jgi:hypothetical protein